MYEVWRSFTMPYLRKMNADIDFSEHLGHHCSVVTQIGWQIFLKIHKWELWVSEPGVVKSYLSIIFSANMFQNKLIMLQ